VSNEPPDRLLEVSDLVVRYGSAQALHGVGLHVYPGEIVGVLGSNGAGKSTLLKTISGVLRPFSGSINFAGADITGKSPAAILRAGISHVAEGRRIFNSQSVRANLEIGAYSRRDGRKAIEADMVRVLDIFPILKTKARDYAATLSGGEQQMLAIGQAMMSAPTVLMMDEPSSGLAPIAIRNLVSRIHELRGSGLTVVIVEQVVALAMELCDRIYFIRNGRIIIDGARPADVHAADIRAAYV
jgi:branched-chain amino acid transport system ATP-binding protein